MGDEDVEGHRSMGDFCALYSSIDWLSPSEQAPITNTRASRLELSRAARAANILAPRENRLPEYLPNRQVVSAFPAFTYLLRSTRSSIFHFRSLA